MQSRKYISTPAVIIDLLDSASHWRFRSPAQTLQMLKALYSRCSLDYKQALVIMQACKDNSALRIELLKKLLVRIEDRHLHMPQIMMFGLTSEERNKVIQAIGILNIVNWGSPTFKYRLSMEEADHRYCMFRLLKLSITGGKVDVRMMKDLRIDGQLIPTSRMQDTHMWHGLLGDELWYKLELHITATGSTYGNMWEWIDHGKHSDKEGLTARTSASMAGSMRPETPGYGGLRAVPEEVEGGAPTLPVELPSVLLQPAPEDPEPPKAGQKPPVAEGPAEAENSQGSLKDGGEAGEAADKEDKLPEGLGRAKVTFEFVVNPELKFKGAIMVVKHRWKEWAANKRRVRQVEAGRRILAWWQAQKRRVELREMQELLDLQEQQAAVAIAASK